VPIDATGGDDEYVRVLGTGAYVYARGMEMTASALRRDIYRVLDRVLETGEPVIIERRGRRIRITAEPVPSRLDSLVRRPDVVVGDSDDFIHLDWSNEWTK
jgi:antitoxin (DNA-binding transcriptional repressor) of toxin-antitoxin stability system